MTAHLETAVYLINYETVLLELSRKAKLIIAQAFNVPDTWVSIRWELKGGRLKPSVQIQRFGGLEKDLVVGDTDILAQLRRTNPKADAQFGVVLYLLTKEASERWEGLRADDDALQAAKT
jgi:hypothetical protein